MATIPVVRGPQTQLSPLGQVGAAAPAIQANASGIGQSTARATAQGAQALDKASADVGNFAIESAKAQARIQAREDAIKGATALEAVENDITTLYTAADQGGNLADPQQITALRDQIGERYSAAAQNFQGSAEGTFLFQQDLTASLNKWNRTLTDRGIAAGKAALSRIGDQKVSELTSVVASNPAALEVAQSEFLAFSARRLAPGLPPEEEAAAVRAGMESMATAAVDYELSNGLYGKALETLNSPLVQPFLSTARARELTVQAYAGMGAATKREAELNASLRLLDQAGITGEDRKRAAAAIVTGHDVLAPRARGPMTLSQKIAEAEAAVGRPLSDDERAKLGSFHIPAGEEKGPFGNDRTLNILNDMATDVRNGTVSAADLQLFTDAAANYITIDQRTGSRNELPLSVREALDARGIDPHLIADQRGVPQLQAARQGLTGARPAAPAAPSAAAAPPTASAGEQQSDQTADRQAQSQQASQAIQPELQAIDSAARVSSATGGDPVAAIGEMDRGGFRFWELANKLTGPISGVQQGVSGIAVIGEILPADDVRRARQGFSLFKTSLVASLSKTERFGDAERKSLEDRLAGLEGKLGGDPGALRADLVAVDDWLATEQEFYEQTLQGEGEVSGQRYQTLLDSLNTIRLARQVLGVPPAVNDRAEWGEVLQSRNVAPGGIVRYKGKLVTVPENGQPPVEVGTPDQLFEMIQAGTIKAGDLVEFQGVPQVITPQAADTVRKFYEQEGQGEGGAQ